MEGHFQNKTNCKLERPSFFDYCTMSYKNNITVGGRHSSVVSSAPTIMQPRIRIPCTPSTLYSNCIFNVGMRKGRK